MERLSLIRLLEELLGRRLSREARIRAVRHITGCPACRRKLAEYRRLRGQLARATDAPGYESQ